MTELDTPAGRQARWRIEHMANADRDLTVEEVVAHFDTKVIGGNSPQEFVENARWQSERFGPFEIDGARSDSPFDAEVTLVYDRDGTELRMSFKVSEASPHRIVDVRWSVEDTAPPEEIGPDRPIVHCIDHFFVPLTEPRAAFELMTKVLRLPVAWPCWLDADGHGNCGIEVGNANLEFLNFDMYDAFVPHTPARVQGIAFEPGPMTDAFLGEIDRRGILHAQPMPWGMFTNVFYGGLIKDPTAVVFTCRYHSPASRDRARRRETLDECGGGELGVTGVDELVIGSTRWQKLVDRWQNFLDPIAPVEPGYWRIGDGPAIRIVEDPEDAVREIVLSVRSVEAAGARVRELGVGTAAPTDDGVLLDLPELNGLVIRLAER